MKGNNYAKGKKWSKESKEKIKNRIPWNRGKRDPSLNYPYSIDFDFKLKEVVRARDYIICQLCNRKSKRKLSVHHIDYNKQNSNEKNLISLCQSCHAKTNDNRSFWRRYFQEIVQFRYILKEGLELKKRKELDYGDSWKIFGLKGTINQIGSKIMRIYNLVDKNKKPNNESLRDSFMDLF